MIRCKNLDLYASEIRNHLDAGMYANKLELIWEGGIEVVCDDQLALKRLRFSDLIMDKLNDEETETTEAQFDVDFAIMTGEFGRFIPALINAFGGLDTSEIDRKG